MSELFDSLNFMPAAVRRPSNDISSVLQTLREDGKLPIRGVGEDAKRQLLGNRRVKTAPNTTAQPTQSAISPSLDGGEKGQAKRQTSAPSAFSATATWRTTSVGGNGRDGLETPQRSTRRPQRDTFGSGSGSSSSLSDEEEEWKRQASYDGRVYWHAPPSPSLELRQAEHRQIMARAMGQSRPPMASQAFRDELLMYSSSANGAKENNQTAEDGLRTTTSSLALRKRLSRRQSRKCGPAHDQKEDLIGAPAAKPSAEGQDMYSIMNELDDHLLKRCYASAENLARQDVEEQGCVGYAGRESVDQDLESIQCALIERMDRAFSQEVDRTNDVGPAPPFLSSFPLARRSAVWTRTTSMPLKDTCPTYDRACDETKCDLAAFSTTLGKRTFPHSPGGWDAKHILRENHRRTNSVAGVKDESPKKLYGKASRESPGKRGAVSAMNKRSRSPAQREKASVVVTETARPSESPLPARDGWTRTVSEGAHQDGVRLQNQRKRPINPLLGRGPRVGLARSNASAQQSVSAGSPNSMTKVASNVILQGPSAPFKVPSRKSARARVKDVPAVNTCEAILLDDDFSDDDRGEKESIHIIPAPVLAARPQRQQEPEEEERSFDDTSFDEVVFCQALEQVEASQGIASVNHTQKPLLSSQTAPLPPSDDSFELSIDDDESAAILLQMDQKGW